MVEVNSITIREHKVKIGDSVDQIFGVLRQGDLISQDVGKDSKNPSSLALTKHYKVGGVTFSVSLAHVVDPGPYVLTGFVIDEPRTESNKRNTRLLNFGEKMKIISALDLSLFCSTSNLACGQASARKVQTMLSVRERKSLAPYCGSANKIAAFRKRLTAALVFILAVIPQEVWSKPFTCAELASFTASIAKFRDQGVPLTTSKKAVADGRMTDADKQLLTKLVGTIYASPDISPVAWPALAETNCKNARRK